MTDGVELAVSASTRTLSCAARGALGQVAGATDRRGSQVVALVARLLGEVGATARQISGIRLDVGPGSYTGLRVAVTFARTVASQRAVPVLTTSSLELIALAAWRDGLAATGDRVRVVLDARRGRCHVAAIALEDAIRLRGEPRAIATAAVAATIEAGEVVLADPASLATLAPAVAARAVRLLPAPEFTATDLFDARLLLHSTPANEVRPLYLMASYAEDAAGDPG